MDRISKALAHLSAREREIVAFILNSLKRGKTVGLDVKKLKGRHDIFRVRKGNLRIIYQIVADRKIVLLAIDRRNEATYKL